MPGWRICVNIANLGRKPYIPLHTFIVQDLIDLGFLMRGGSHLGQRWNCQLIGCMGDIYVCKKPCSQGFSRVHPYLFKGVIHQRHKRKMTSTITREEFIEYTRSVWSFNAESATKVGHPASYPVDLPARCIKLFTFEGELVLDPFMGSRTTAVAAIELKRHFVGYDVDPTYIDIAEKRIKAPIGRRNQQVLQEEH